MTELITEIESCIKRAEALSSRLAPSVLEIPGMSSPKIRHFLNNLCGIPDRRYLEVGCFQGSTLVSSLYSNQATVETAVAIDDFSEFGGPEAELRKNIADFLAPMGDRLTLVNAECFGYAPNLKGRRFNTYLYDGGHTEQQQYDAFVCFDAALDDTFVAMVDDWSWPEASGGTRRAFKDLKYRVVTDWELPTYRDADTENWWNGFYVAVVQKP
jgi:hypothetical protein